MNKLPVVFLTDDNYVIPTSVAIQSMLDNSVTTKAFDIYIIAKDVSEKNKANLLAFASENVEVSIIDVEDISLKKYDEAGYYVSSTALLKFDIADLLPQYDKVLYIDGDVLVLKDVGEMYQIDVEGYCVAAIPDMAAIDACHFDEHLDIRNYFNSGVMLLNTKLIREEGLAAKLYDIKKKHPEYQCMDQDVFNDGFSRRVLFLPPKYNLMFYNFIIANFSLDRVNEFYNTRYESFEKMEKDAVIIHLTNEKKPWKYKDAYKSEEWRTYFDKTPYAKNGGNVFYEEQPEETRYVVHKGPFVKISTLPLTTLYLGKIPLVKKYRRQNGNTIKILGIPVYKSRSDGFRVKRYFMGVRYQKVYDAGYFTHRLNVYKDIIKMALYQFATCQTLDVQDGELGSTYDQMNLYRQLDRLKNMRKEYEKKENKNETSL